MQSARTTTSAVRSDGEVYVRHTVAVRVLHWINALALTVLLMSGLNIFSAHPALYWGRSSYSGQGPMLVIGAREAGNGLIGVTRVFGREFETTGVFGAVTAPGGEVVSRTFPSWLTLPGERWLAMARRWHFLFAWIFVINGVCYLAHAIASRHLARDLVPTPVDWRSIGASLRDHLLFRRPAGQAGRRYNVLQKLAYLGVIFALLPLVALTGWAMSPWLDAAIPGWVDVLGGRQSARTLHFIVAWLLVAFALVHVWQVIAGGFWNHMRSMITGRYRVERVEAR